MINGKKVIHVVGTGTIGEPLIGLLCTLRGLGIFDKDTIITFQKVSPESKDEFKVNELKKRGALFAVAREKTEEFIKADMVPDLTQNKALEQADIVIDCTPHGLARKKEVYLDRVEDTLLFVAQGNAFQFGPQFAGWTNDKPIFEKLKNQEEKFIQVVSCNTHAILETVTSIGLLGGSAGPENVIEVQFCIVRRANDISQSKSFVPAPQVGAHDDPIYGTHQARDAALLLKESFGYDLDIRSSVFKANTQLMHANWFSARMQTKVTRDEIIDILKANPLVAITERDIANEIFSCGRDHGYFGRILNKIVVPIHKRFSKEDRYPLTVFQNRDGSTSVTGFSFTPQDGNSLLSSSKIALMALYPDSYEERADKILTNENPQFVFSRM